MSQGSRKRPGGTRGRPEGPARTGNGGGRGPARPPAGRPPERAGARPLRPSGRRGHAPYGLHYDPSFLAPADRAAILAWLARLRPIWEERYSTRRPPPERTGREPSPPGSEPERRRLLRPVYWLGNWQFACLDYYRPSQGRDGVTDRCVAAEPVPPVLARMVARIEDRARRMFHPDDLPRGWRLNTCLVNFDGARLEAGKRVDSARVGEHKDFEPGPVASVSLGERALFQFVTSRRPGERDAIVQQQWLDDGSLQIFGGDRWKRGTFHRVQRVDRREGHRFPPEMPDFETRRVNFTFRFVPEAHVTPFALLGAEAREDVREYVQRLAESSPFWKQALEADDSDLGPR